MTTNVRNAEGSVRKAAVLLASLPRAESDDLLSKLEAHEAQAVSQEMGRIAPIDSRERQGVMLEFVVDGRKARRRSQATSNLAESNPATADDRAPLAFLRALGNEDLIGCVQAEHPQTIALVISHLPADLAGATLAGLPPEVAAHVRRRMARMSPCNELLLEDVALGLRETLSRLPRDPAFPRISVIRKGALDREI